MKNKNPPDERVVYLALKHVFKGVNAEARQLKVVRKLITKSKSDTDVADLLKEHNIDIVCNMARTLLTEDIFKSTIKAKIRFPEVFDVSPVQSAEREASEAEAAINEANAIQGVVQAYSEDAQNLIHHVDLVETESVETCHNPKPPTVQSTVAIPSLFPVYLPLGTQHRILTDLQRLLEDACFDFAQRAMPDVLEKKGWGCSEAAELNLWAAEFQQRQSHFSDKVDDVGRPLPELLRSVAHIRHTAVHRICISARGLEQFLMNAESFMTLLGDTARLRVLTGIRRNVQQTIEELERNKHVLSSKLKETLRRLAAQRAELDRVEEAAILNMMREDGEYQASAGKNLEEVVTFSEVTFPVAAAKEDETSSDTDETDPAADFHDSVSSQQLDDEG
ncbi:putative ubiquinol-cytochrome-c reductase cytochrome [Rosellinia necatrix]|uniref:Putative ubiquinol-cytochrome-c reductase cytochrome n=1 Tax=Rosellinia necatrix TaxID=77044 RepID=A0A1W2TE67_ROSNE|nr:putative ubiquinol-cytochrome-c reductase cytochrome [Rosellinia necatrix]